VAADHPLSNLGLLRRSVPDAVVPLVETPTTLSADADAANARIAALPRFDLVWLGVGGDGHSASWFPGPDLAAALDPASTRHVLAVTPDPLPPEAPVARLTLSLARVLAARRILIVATGTAKRAILESPGGLPIAAVLESGHPDICIHWSE
jgi:6-phosphogluconolactonase